MLPALLSAALCLSSGMPRHAEISAADGVVVHLDHWDRDDGGDGPTLVLFHQAGSNKQEYITIAPRLFDRGYNVVVVDQRSGGTFSGHGENATANRYVREKRIKGKVPYIDALPDLKAAIAFAKKGHPGGKVAVWGSSYSAALVFLVAAEDPTLGAVLAFSPGEYLGKTKVAPAAARVKQPVFIATPKKEAARAHVIAQSLPQPTTVQTPAGAVHGSSMLLTRRSKTAAKTWRLVETFLDKHFPPAAVGESSSEHASPPPVPTAKPAR